MSVNLSRTNSTTSKTAMKDSPGSSARGRVEVISLEGGGHDRIVQTTEELTGHKQELRVSMGLGALLALSFANMAPTVAINGSLSISMSSGGPLAVLWGWVIVAFICLAIASSLAELCSAWPHPSGQAYWAYKLAPPAWAPFWSYWTAWMNIAGGHALIAAGAYIFAAGILGIVIAYNPSYEERDWHLVLLYLGLLAVFFVVNLFIVRILDACTKGFALINITSVLATIIALAACAPVKQSPKWVFTEFINETGWSNSGLVFLLGLVQAGFVIIGFEASAHLCEEAHDAGRLAPLAIFGGTSLVAVVGLCWIITLLFCMGDLDSVLGSATGEPFYQILINAFNLNGATVAFLINLIVLGFAVIGIICASSRAVWAQARDKAFPGSVLFSRVNHRLQVPVYACALQVIVPAILGLIYLGSPTIFLAFFQLTTVGYMASYFIPVALLFFRGRHLLPHGIYWRMPDWLAMICNIVTLLYAPFITVLFCIPNYYPVTSTNANYTSPIAAVAILIGTIGWFLECRRTFKEPSASHSLE
ncbi:hypothetical protein JCM8547_007143 [Rhodosporidiobolus lusitaniae]